MDSDDIFLGSDEHCVLQYLNSWPDEFVPELQIARRAFSKNRFDEEPHWASNALFQLLNVGLVESDGAGRYRLKSFRKTAIRPAKFIAPEMLDILAKSGRKFDLSAYGTQPGL